MRLRWWSLEAAWEAYAALPCLRLMVSRCLSVTLLQRDQLPACCFGTAVHCRSGRPGLDTNVLCSVLLCNKC